MKQDQKKELDDILQIFQTLYTHCCNSILHTILYWSDWFTLQKTTTVSYFLVLHSLSTTLYELPPLIICYLLHSCLNSCIV